MHEQVVNERGGGARLVDLGEFRVDDRVEADQVMENARQLLGRDAGDDVTVEFLIEGHQADGVAVLEITGGERDGGLDAVLELLPWGLTAAHGAGDIEHHVDAHGGLVLEVLGDELAAAHGGLPRDVAQRITRLVLSQFAHVGAHAEALDGVAPSLATREPGGHLHAAHGAKLGVDLERREARQVVARLKQSERIAHAHIKAVHHPATGARKARLEGGVDLGA